MAIPKFNELFTPVLQNLSIGGEKPRRDLIDEVQATLNLTPEESSETLKTGGSRVGSRIAWAAEHLAQARAVERPKRGVFRITQRGAELLKDHPDGVTLDDLKGFPETLEWYARSKAGKVEESEQAHVEEPTSILATPMEEIEQALISIESVVVGDLLDRLQKVHWSFFEHLVLKLLIAMGYGASPTHFEHLGGPGDEGVDGVIFLDELGLEEVYVQAKRYADPSHVGPSEIQKFAGALIAKHSMKGVFFTTSHFSKDAAEMARKISPQRIILVDGQDLAELMITHRVGVTTKKAFEVSEVDENFFSDE